MSARTGVSRRPIGDDHHPVHESLRAENEMLRETLAAFRREFLGATLVFPGSWRLSPSETKMLAVLVMRPQVSREQMLLVLMRPDRHEGADAINVLMVSLRRKIAPVQIHTIHSVGWSINAADRGRLRDLYEYRVADRVAG